MNSASASTAQDSSSLAAAANPRIVGYQCWRNLLFLHWRVPAAELQRQLPAALKVEEFDGSAWLGLVPFSMERVRPWWSTPVPGISWFLETNVRTYVRHTSGQTGVWFFSLHANSRLAVAVARKFWHLNYINAELRLNHDSHRLNYSGTQTVQPERSYEISCEPAASESLRTAGSNTLDHFLLERYTLLTHRKNGEFNFGQVHHLPYTFRPVHHLRCSQTLTEITGITLDPERTADHAVYSPGVDVRVSPLLKI